MANDAVLKESIKNATMPTVKRPRPTRRTALPKILVMPVILSAPSEIIDAPRVVHQHGLISFVTSRRM
jgi:hypothetical protein